MLNPTKLKHIEKAFDLDAIGTLHAVEYPIGGANGVWIVDGQHRLTALLAHGFEDWEVSVMIHSGVKTDAAASQLFLRLNDRANVGTFDKYLNELRAGHPAAVGMTKVVEARGLRVDRYNGTRTTSAIACLRAAYALDGGRSLGLALKLIEDAWGFKGASLEGKLVEGLATFLAKNSAANLDLAGFTKRLSKSIPAQIIASAKVNSKSIRQSLSKQLCDDLTRIYNTKRSTGVLEIHSGLARQAMTTSTSRQLAN